MAACAVCASASEAGGVSRFQDPCCLLDCSPPAPAVKVSIPGENVMLHVKELFTFVSDYCIWTLHDSQCHAYDPADRVFGKPM